MKRPQVLLPAASKRDERSVLRSESHRELRGAGERNVRWAKRGAFTHARIAKASNGASVGGSAAPSTTPICCSE